MGEPRTLLDQALTAVREERPSARAMGVELVGIVGSIARGEGRTDSDVDVVYDVIGRPTLLDLGAIVVELEDRLGRRVDLIGREAMKPDRWAYMGRDLVVA
ncbi:nucleotidyltransferase domain-containing protein [Brevundimonas sp.]|uniref:nucleotidyltransferase domain-containing protein n=1 Tax=Brevundimonas sp. TaxID=1871086 RepID=UPI002FDB3365